jgi:hypothetical protein
MRLVAWGQLAREQVCGIAVSGHRMIKPSSVNPIMVGLRKKLRTHEIVLTTIHGFGWSLPQKDRDWIVGLIKP